MEPSASEHPTPRRASSGPRYADEHRRPRPERAWPPATATERQNYFISSMVTLQLQLAAVTSR